MKKNELSPHEKLIKMFRALSNSGNYSDEEILEAAIEILTEETVIMYIKETVSKDNLMDEDTMVQELTERGYNVIRTTSLKEQIELEEWLARQYPKMNMRESIYLTI